MNSKFEIIEFWFQVHNLVIDLKSTFRGRVEVEIQQKASFWKAESLSFPISKELASEDASISRYGDFESDHFVVRRLRRRAFGVKITNFK